jgi:hypothetical protein
MGAQLTETAAHGPRGARSRARRRLVLVALVVLVPATAAVRRTAAGQWMTTG